jgi:hypothetical protein
MCLRCLTGPPVWRLRLASGGHVFLEFHSFTGPYFFRDHACRREIEEWYGVQEIVDALDWWIKRGKRG